MNRSVSRDCDDERDWDDHVKNGRVALVAVGIKKIRNDARAQNDGRHLSVGDDFAEPQREATSNA